MSDWLGSVRFGRQFLKHSDIDPDFANARAARAAPDCTRALGEGGEYHESAEETRRQDYSLVRLGGSAGQSASGIAYYETVSKRMGDAATRDFYRLFMVPGMFHCSGGPGCGNVDWLAALMDWVEKGVAPDQLTGAHLEKGQPTRTRPLCPYPQVAKYRGTGSIDDAANFECRMP